MSNVAMVFGALLVILGVVGYAASEGASLTAMIPAAFGIILALLGVLATYPKYRKHAMHAAAGLSLLGFFATVPGVFKILTILQGGTVERPKAAFSQAIMAVLTLAFVVLCVRSFIAARRNAASENVG